ncbi:MAG: type II toxin-antitoxin system RelE/ParE family toxin [Pseudomonadota bacterium]
MKILIAESAFSDLENIKAYYTEQGVPVIGQNFVAAIIEHIQTLADYPSIGRVVPEFDKEHIREIIHSPFRIVYLREESVVQIIRVWRSERLLRLPEA